jgi:hypothetical protein
VCLFVSTGWCQLLLQVLALADTSQAELRRSIADLTKKCDDLLRHKRFLANQAAESSAFSAAAKRKNSRKSQQGGAGDEQEVDGGVLGAVQSGEVEVHSEDEEAGEAGGEDDLECAVCRSAMSEELQVRVLITQKVTQVTRLQTLLFNMKLLSCSPAWIAACLAGISSDKCTSALLVLMLASFACRCSRAGTTSVTAVRSSSWPQRLPAAPTAASTSPRLACFACHWLAAVHTTLRYHHQREQRSGTSR